MRALVASDTEPPPFRTLLVVWKLTPDRAATSLTETCRVALRALTLPVLCAGSERSPLGGFATVMGPRPEYPRPALRRAAWVSLNGEGAFRAGPAPAFDRRNGVPFW